MKQKSFFTAEKLYREQKEQLMQYVLAQISGKEKAEDIVADTFLEAILKNDWLEMQNAKDQLEQLYAIAQRLCDRTKEPTDLLPLREETGYHSSYEDQYRTQELAIMDQRSVIYELKDLYQEDKELMLMRYRDGKSVKEIAEEKGISMDAVYKRLQRAKEKIRYYEKHRK